MKYIVFWIVWKSIEVPCPEQWRYDIDWGKGASCAVGHFKNIDIEHTAGFSEYDSAKVFYQAKLKEHEKNNFSIAGDSTNKMFFKFDGAVDSVRIDSIKYGRP